MCLTNRNKFQNVPKNVVQIVPSLFIIGIRTIARIRIKSCLWTCFLRKFMHEKVFIFPFFLGEILSECMRRATKLSDRKFNEPEKNIVDYQHLRCRVLWLFTKERAANKRESSRLNGINNEMNDSLTLVNFPLKSTV